MRSGMTIATATPITSITADEACARTAATAHHRVAPRLDTSTVSERPGRAPRLHVRRIAREEVRRHQPETGGVNGHDRPILDARQMGDGQRVPEHHVVAG